MIFVVAEIGVNWDGDFSLVEKMMSESKKAGCNAVKFQAYNQEIVKNHPEKNRLLKSAISQENIEKIDDLAKSVGIEWFCTPMYPKAVDMLDPYVNRYKIREVDGRELLENETTQLFEKIMTTNKEIFVSSESNPKNSKYIENPKIHWLYCVPKYPCDLTELDFTNFKNFEGFSNHTPSIVAPLSAAVLGAKILEIHITSDKNKNFFDNNVSFDYNELRNLLGLIRETEKIKYS